MSDDHDQTDHDVVNPHDADEESLSPNTGDPPLDNSAPPDNNDDDDTRNNASHSTTGTSYTPYYLQSPNIGDDYAGGLSYDPDTNSLYLTGSTYSHIFPDDPDNSNSNSNSNDSNDFPMGDLRCFVTMIDLTTRSHKWTTSFKSSTKDDGTSLSGCSAVTHISNHPLPVGQIEKSNVVLSSHDDIILENTSTDAKTVTGFVLGLADASAAAADAPPTLSGKIMLESRVQYPVAIATPHNTTDVVIAMMTTDDDEINLNYELSEEESTLGRGRDPNGPVPKYGAVFSIQIQNYRYDPIENRFAEGWSRMYGSEERGDVRVSGLIAVDGLVLFAGTTADVGTMFGGMVAVSRKDLDGFVTKLEVGSGRVPTEEVYTTRIRSDPGDNDIVSGLCVSRREGVESVYVVGSTTGLLDPSFDHYYTVQKHDKFYAFLMKLDLKSLEVMWTRQVGTYSKTARDVLGVGCAVTDDDETVYMTGLASSGGSVLDDMDEGFGDDDIFIVSYDTKNGEQDFIKQVGSDKNDILARGSGSIFTDERGNAFVYGSTRGRLFRADKDQSQQDADIFFLSFERGTGEHEPLIQGDAPFGSPSDTVGSSSSSKNTVRSESNPYDTVQITGIAIGIALAVIAILIAVYAWGVRQSDKRHQREMELAQRSMYDDDDFELNLGGSGGTSHRLRKIASPAHDQEGYVPDDSEMMEFDYARHGGEGGVDDDDAFMPEGGSTISSTYDELLSSLDSIGGLRASMEKMEAAEKESAGEKQPPLQQNGVESGDIPPPTNQQFEIGDDEDHLVINPGHEEREENLDDDNLEII